MLLSLLFIFQKGYAYISQFNSSYNISIMTAIIEACSVVHWLLLVLIDFAQQSYQRTTFHYLLCPT